MEQLGEVALRNIVREAVDGIIAISEQGIIQAVNPAVERIFGYTEQELLGQNVKILMPEPYHGEHDTYLRNYLHTGVKKIIGIGREVLGRRKDGTVFPIDLAVSEVRFDQHRVFTGVIRDITERKAAERQLREAMAKAEAANRAKDHFLAIVSHELRTPLNPILATAEYLERTQELPQSLRNEIAVIRRNVEQEARMVDDLLNLTRLQRNKIELHQEVLNVHTAIHTAVSQFQREIDRKRIELTISLRAHNNQVWADPGRIEQVLANLLSNAVKFTPDGGRITVQSSNPSEHRLRVEVIDTGVGIDPEVLPHLFQPFEQGERSTSRRFGGLGLGLVIAKGIVDLHQGSLTARSDGKDKGTTFTLELAAVPLVPDAPAGAGTTGTGSSRRGEQTINVLLVEDHEDTLRVMAKLITWMGHRVLTAGDMTQAMELIAREEFDLLVSDIGLPDGSGLTVMKSLRQQQPGAKGIALSGFGLEEDKRRSAEAGFSEHLVKPVNIQRLESVIRTLLRARKDDAEP